MTRSPGAIAAIGLGVLLLAFALSVDFPKTAQGFKGDEATYYSLAHSLARDADFTFERKDLVRVWEEFPGPEGIFLKRGKATRIEWIGQPPFFRWVKSEDPKRSRLYYAKSYIYPLAASPFVFLLAPTASLCCTRCCWHSTCSSSICSSPPGAGRRPPRSCGRSRFSEPRWSRSILSG